MNELVKWLKENVGDNIQVITPQFERVGKRDFTWKPKTKSEFQTFIEKAPWKILKGCGFRKWDSMNNCIRENMRTPKHDVFKIPIINGKPDEEMVFDAGRKNHPTLLLKTDEDIILFPSEWYDVIPDGFIVTGLWAESYPFKKGETDDDIRFGCLAYGIRRPTNQ